MRQGKNDFLCPKTQQRIWEAANSLFPKFAVVFWRRRSKATCAALRILVRIGISRLVLLIGL